MKEFTVRGQPRAPRIAVIQLSSRAAMELQKHKQDEPVLIPDSIFEHCKMLYMFNKLSQTIEPADEDWANLVLKIYDDQQLPKMVDGWKINYNYDESLSARKQKKQKKEFHLQFYKNAEEREKDLRALRER